MRWDGAPGAGRGADGPRAGGGVEGGLARATGQGLGTCQRRCGDLRVPRPRDTGIRKSSLRNGSERARSRRVATERRFRAVVASAGCWPSRGGRRPPAPCAGLGSLVWARCMAPPHSALPQLREGEAVPSPARRTATGSHLLRWARGWNFLSCATFGFIKPKQPMARTRSISLYACAELLIMTPNHVRVEGKGVSRLHSR